jgi:hypothetical protein
MMEEKKRGREGGKKTGRERREGRKEESPTLTSYHYA